MDPAIREIHSCVFCAVVSIVPSFCSLIMVVRSVLDLPGRKWGRIPFLGLRFSMRPRALQNRTRWFERRRFGSTHIPTVKFVAHHFTD